MDTEGGRGGGEAVKATKREEEGRESTTKNHRKLSETSPLRDKVFPSLDNHWLAEIHTWGESLFMILNLMMR